jgi:DNA-binding transcriptional regulator YiaG
MRTLYDEDLDYLEVVEEGVKNYAVEATEALSLFLNEKNKAVVGFALEGATENLKDLENVPPKARLAGLLRLMRSVRHLNQEEFAKLTNIGIRTLQRAEAGDANLTFDNLVSLAQAAPKIDFSVVLKPMKKVKGL